MDKQVQKIKKLGDNFFHRSKDDLLKEWGKPLKHSDNKVWFYNQYSRGVFKDEISFVFEEDVVADIMVTQYFFWIEYQNMFYYEGEDNECRVMKF